MVDDASPTAEGKRRVAPFRSDPRLKLFQASRNVGPYRLVNWLCGYMFAKATSRSTMPTTTAIRTGCGMQLKELVNSRVDIVGSSFVRVSESGDVIGVDRVPRNASREFARGNCGCLMHPTMLMRKAILGRLGGFDGAMRFGADSEFQLRASLAHCKMRNIERPLYYYRQREGSLTSAPETGGGIAGPRELIRGQSTRPMRRERKRVEGNCCLRPGARNCRCSTGRTMSLSPCANVRRKRSRRDWCWNSHAHSEHCETFTSHCRPRSLVHWLMAVLRASPIVLPMPQYT